MFPACVLMRLVYGLLWALFLLLGAALTWSVVGLLIWSEIPAHPDWPPERIGLYALIMYFPSLTLILIPYLFEDRQEQQSSKDNSS